MEGGKANRSPELRDNQETQPGGKKRGRKGQGARYDHPPFLGGHGRHGLVTDLAHAPETGAQDGQQPVGLRRRLESLQRHGQRCIGKCAQLFGKAGQI